MNLELHHEGERAALADTSCKATWIWRWQAYWPGIRIMLNREIGGFKIELPR